MMMSEGIDDLADGLATLEAEFGQAASLAQSFAAELARTRDAMLWTNREVAGLSRSIGSGLRRAFDGLVFDGMRLSDALRAVGESMANAAYSAAIRPVQDALGAAIASGVNGLVSGILPFADGAAFSQGRVVPFASGGIVRGPTLFPMRAATGLMGEAGPEAIMPLARGPDGRLGVRAEGGAARPVNVVINVTTPDVEGFRRSQTQIAAQLGRVLGRGARNR